MVKQIFIHVHIFSVSSEWQISNRILAKELTFMFESGADKGINSDKLQLHIIAIKGAPFSIHKLLNLDRVVLQKRRPKRCQFLWF